MIGLVLIVAAGGCGTTVQPLAAGNAALDPRAYFTGRTHGEGELNKLFSPPIKVSVDSIGRRMGDTLILDQTILEADKRPQTRRWTMRPDGPNRYSGSLTDATGSVQVTVSGPRAYIRYAMKGGLHVVQQLALQDDGRTVLNRLEVRKFGAPVATLNETIRKPN